MTKFTTFIKEKYKWEITVYYKLEEDGGNTIEIEITKGLSTFRYKASTGYFHDIPCYHITDENLKNDLGISDYSLYLGHPTAQTLKDICDKHFFKVNEEERSELKKSIQNEFKNEFKQAKKENKLIYIFTTKNDLYNRYPKDLYNPYPKEKPYKHIFITPNGDAVCKKTAYIIKREQGINFDIPTKDEINYFEDKKY